MPKILIVEDDLDTVAMITVMLELRNYEVIVARDGIEGINSACDLHPDLIVTDLRMPEIDGIEMIKLLRSDASCGTVPILVITGSSMELAKEAMEAGAGRVLRKPFSPDLLHVFIKDLLSKQPIQAVK